jgi:hypothetical protein
MEQEPLSLQTVKRLEQFEELQFRTPSPTTRLPILAPGDSQTAMPVPLVEPMSSMMTGANINRVPVRIGNDPVQY